MKADAIIVAAGSGQRFSGDTPKQLTPILGRPMIAWAVEPFLKSDAVTSITVVTAPGEGERIRDALAGVNITVDRTVDGGDTRQQSVWRGLQALDSDSDNVMIHDAARPCLTTELVDRILGALADHEAVIPTVPAVDTLVREAFGQVKEIVDRNKIRHVQTPQAFRTVLALQAHENAVAQALKVSDDGSLVVALGEKLYAVPGSADNIKITYETDIQAAERVLSERQE